MTSSRIQQATMEIALEFYFHEKKNFRVTKIKVRKHEVGLQKEKENTGQNSVQDKTKSHKNPSEKVIKSKKFIN